MVKQNQFQIFRRRRLTQIQHEIIDGIRAQEETKQSLNEAVSKGRSKESWFAGEMKKATSGMSAIESAKYLQSLDETLEIANQELW